MRTKFSENSILPFYPSIQEREYYSFNNNIPVLVFPSFADIKFQLCFKNEPFVYQGGSLWSVLGNHVPSSIGNTTKIEDVNNDGSNEYFLQVDGITFSENPSETKYYMEILVDGVSYYSETFFICSAKYKIEWYDDCDRKDYGYFTNGFKNVLYLNDFYPTLSSVNDIIEERSDGYGGKKKVYEQNIYSYTGKIKGANFLRHTINNIKAYDNIVLTHIVSSETWTIEDLKAESSGDGGAFGLDISYTTSPNEKLDCIVPAFENAPYVDPNTPDPEDLTCGSFGVTIVQAGFELSYTLSNDPDPATVESIWWTRNGRYIGSGATVTLGVYGNYGVRIQKKNCIVVDYYSWQDVCPAMQAAVTVNNGQINAVTTNAPDTVAYAVYNPSGTEVATSLPYTAVVDGIHTLKVVSDVCEKVYQVPVHLTGSIDCSFTFDVTKSATNLLSIANNTAGSYSVEWFKVINSNEEVSVGTGDTYQIATEGLYIARMTSSGCDKDVIYVYLESDTTTASRYQGYQRNLGVSGTSLAVTKFTLPHPTINSETEIDERLIVKVNGSTLYYKTTPSAVDHYTIDFANNEIDFYYSLTSADVQLYRNYIEN